MTKYTHDTIVPYKDSELGKKQQIAEMFDRIAFRYDFLNRFLSGGIDLYWRKKAIRELAPAGDGRTGKLDGAGKDGISGMTGYRPRQILDVATGTGDMAIMMTKYLSPEKITGIDISTGMLEIGRQKIGRQKLTEKVELQTGDSEAIHFPDNSFDAVTVAFGVRNFENLEKGLQEMLRVLKPGGRLVVLEFSKPKQGLFKRFYDLYLRFAAPRISKMLSSNREAYQYLNDSVKAFPEGEAFIGILSRTGYIRTRLRRLSMGICTIYVGEKL